MSYEFVAKNGLISQGNTTVTGSLVATQNITGSNITASGTGSFGRVGVGSSQPSAKLDIRETSAATGLKVFVNDTSTANIAQFIGYDNSLGDTTRMVIQAGGNVGIGTTTPDLFSRGYNRILGISGSSTAIEINASSGSAAYFDMGVAGTRIGALYTDSSGFEVGTPGAKPLYLFTNGSYKMTILSNGNVGIGTTNPSDLLSVQGDVNLNYNSNGSSRIWRTFASNHASGNRGANLLFGMYDGSPAGMNVTNTSSSNSSYNSQYLTFLTHEGGVSADERMRITPLGNVGIGTTNPSYLLDVYGSIRSKANTATGTILLGETSGGTSYVAAALIGTPSPAYNPVGKLSIQIPTHGVGTDYGLTEQMSIQVTSADTKSGTIILLPNSGYVGIGTTSPAYLLDVSGSTRHGYRTSDNHYFTGSVNISGSLNATASWAINSLTSSRANSLNAANSYTVDGLTANYVEVVGLATIPTTGIYRPATKSLGLSADGTLIFKISNAASPATSSIETGNFIVQSGNVGIGTTSPIQKLDVRGDVYFTGSTLLNLTNRLSNGNAADPLQVNSSILLGGAGGTYTFGKLSYDTSNNTFNIIANANPANLGVDSSIVIKSGTSGGGGPNEIARFVGNGNVGIGTTSPSGSFHIYNSTSYNAILETTTANNVQLRFRKSGTDKWSIYVGNSSNDLTFWDGTSDRVTFQNGGNVGIGTTTVGALLAVNGDAFFAAKITIKGSAAGSLGNTSGLQLYQDSGTDTSYLYNYYAGSMVFGTSNVERMRILSGGNVGIGTTTPTSLLELSSSTASSLLNVKGSGGNGLLYVSGSGNVGVGLTNPAYKLDVNGSINTNNFMFVSYQYGNAFPLQLNASNFLKANDYYYGMTINSGDVNYISGKFLINGGTYKRVELYGYENGIGYIPTVIPGGNVGIGTINPSYLLDVSGSSRHGYRTTDNHYFTGSVNISGSLNATASWAISASYAPGGAASLSGGTTNYVPLWTSSTTLSTSSIYQSGSGNIGIGTTNPSQLLELKKTTGSAIALLNYNDSVKFNINASSAGVGYVGMVSNHDLLFVTNDTERGRLTTGGNLGIGTTGPNYRLDVSGSAIRSFVSSGSGAEPGFIVDYPSSNGYGAFFVHVNGTRRWRIGSVGDLNAEPALNFHQEGTGSRMYIGSNGYVGIGTTAVAGNLDVYSSAASSHYVRSSVSAIRLLAYGDGTNWIQSGTSTSNSSADLIFSSMNGVTQWMRIQGSTGNVGIGTSSPSELFTVYGTNKNIRISNTAAYNAAGTAYLGFDGVYNSSNAFSWFSRIVSGKENTTDGDLRGYFSIQTNNPSSGIADRIRVDSNGNVGIGTTVPSVRLHVSGSSIIANNTSIDPDAYSNSVIAGAISDRAGWGISSGIGGNAGTGHSWAVGTNGSSLYMGYGNGSANDTLQEFLQVSSSRNMYLVPSSGNVGVGTLNTYQKLTINGAIETGANGSTTGGPAFYIKYDGAGGNYINSIGTEYSSGNTVLGYGVTGKSSSAGYVSTFANFSGHRGMLMVGAGTLEFKNSRASLSTAVGSDVPMTSSFYIDNSGNVGIGTASPASILHTAGSGDQVVRFTHTDNVVGRTLTIRLTNNNATYLNSGTYIQSIQGAGIDYYSMAFGTTNNSTTSTERMRIDYNGNVGIGTTSPGAKLEITGSSNSALLNIKSPISGAILYVSGSGAVGIGTSAVGAYTLQVSGSFGATTKSFIIEHPTKEGKKLVYGSLESPYHGIRLTGRSTLKEGKCKVELPDYIYKLILHDSVNIQLTGIKCNKVLYIDEINVSENYFTIAYDKTIFESYTDYDFFWDFTAIRADVPELETEV